MRKVKTEILGKGMEMSIMMKRRKLGDKLLAWMIILVMVLGLLPNNVIIAEAEESTAIDATLSLGEFNENTKKFDQATGSGSATFCSMVIGFNLTKEDVNESITLPTVDGFSYQDGISSDYSKIISMSPAKTASEIAEYIKQVTINGGSKGQEISVTLNSEEIKYRTFYWGGNGHFYQYVPFDSLINDYKWMTAYNTAKSMEYNGRKGYLATVTSKEEDLYIFEASSKVGWLGGTRLKHTGDGDWRDWIFDTSDQSGTDWYWACGPEAGSIFYDVAKITSSTYSEADSRNIGSNYYFNWERGGGTYLGYEPNSGTKETCLATLTLSGGKGYATKDDVTGYSWNDLTNEQTSAGGNWDSKGFFVEYGDQINGDSSDSQSSVSSTTVSVGATVEASLPDWATGAGLDKEKVEWNAREDFLKLKKDIELTAPITLPADTNLTIDLNGSKLTGADGQPAIKAAGGSVNLKLQDSTGGGVVTGGKGIENNEGGSGIDFSNATGSSSIQLDNNITVQGGNGCDAATENGNGSNGGDAIKGGSTLSITVGGSTGETKVLGGKGGTGNGTGNGGDGGAGISGSGVTITVGGDSVDKKGTVVGGDGGDMTGTGSGGNGGSGVSGSTCTTNTGGSVTNGQGGTKQHGHTWKYEASNSKISAYCVESELADKCSYQGTDNAIILTLSATDATYSGNPASATFGNDTANEAWTTNVGALPAIQYQTKNADGTWGDATDTAPANAGTYKAVATVGTGADAKTVEKEFRITPVTIGNAGVTLDQSLFDVTTSAQGPAVTVKATVNHAEITLTEGSDYEITGDVSETEVGNYSLTVTGKGNYTGTVTKNWSITKPLNSITNLDITVDTSKIPTLNVGDTIPNYGSQSASMSPFRLPDNVEMRGFGFGYYAYDEDGRYTDSKGNKLNSSPCIDDMQADAETLYAYYIELQAKDGYKFDENITIANGSDSHFAVEQVIADVDEDGNGNYLRIRYDMGTLEDIGELKGENQEVTGVNVKDGIDPGIVYDGEPVTLLEIFTGTPSLSGSPSGSEIISYKWAKKTDGSDTYEEATATAPTDVGSYKLIITLESGDNYGTKEITFQIVKKNGPAAPSGLTSTAATFGESDGKIVGLDSTKNYEYSTDDGTTWTAVAVSSFSISGLPAGTVKVREKETATTKAGAEVTVVVKSKQAKPELRYISEPDSANQIGKIGLTNSGESDGLTSGVAYEYTTDITDTKIYQTIVGDGTNYIPVTKTGVYYVRLKGTEALESSPWVPVTAENAIVADGMVSDLSSTGVQLTAIMASTTGIKEAGFRYKVKGSPSWTTEEAASPNNATFTSTLTGLAADTDYVYQAYVTNDNNKTVYGKEMSFRTSATAATGSIKIKVTNEDTVNDKDIVATIEAGNTVIASKDVKVNANDQNVEVGPFTHLADGTYNVVVRTKDGKYTETNLIIISGGNAAETAFSIPTGKISTTVELKDDTPNIAVGGLKDIITQEEKSAAASGTKSVDVELVAEKKAETAITIEAAEIKEIAARSSKMVDTFLDLSIFKTTSTLEEGSVTSVEKQDIGSMNTTVLEIAIPYENITKTGLTMYKYHDGEASELIELGAKPTAEDSKEDGTFYLDKSTKYIYLYAKEFSTYAIGYNKETPAPETPAPTPNTGGGSSSGGGSSYYYPVTGITVTPEKATLTKVGETLQIIKTISPSFATNQNVTWFSDNEAVVKVDSTGKVTAVGNGIATITVTTQSGNKVATIVITVNTTPEETIKPSVPTGTDTPIVPSGTDTPSVPTVTDKPVVPGTPEPTTPVETDKPIVSAAPVITVTPIVTVTPEAPKPSLEPTAPNGTEAPKETATPEETATPMVTVTPKPTVKPTAKPKKVTSDFGTLKAKSVKQTSTTVRLSWTKLSDADGYLVYGSRCNSKGKIYTKKLIKTIKGNSTVTWTQKKLDKATYYKYQIKAYKIVDDKKVIIAQSVELHATTKGGKYCVASAVKVSKLAGKKVSKSLKLTLKKGKTAQITASETPAEKNKNIHYHRALCYETSNSKVATVTKDGKIKAVGKGTCKIWVYAQNGVYKTIAITVK